MSRGAAANVIALELAIGTSSREVDMRDTAWTLVVALCLVGFLPAPLGAQVEKVLTNPMTTCFR